MMVSYRRQPKEVYMYACMCAEHINSVCYMYTILPMVYNGSTHLLSLQNTQVVWQWLENIHGRWCSFSSDVTQRIERAYKNGEPLVRVFSGRHRHVIQFTSMVQVSFMSNS